MLTTPAVILRVIPYGETSKILRLLTRDAGMLSGMARGARRAKARTGPRLDIFASGSATLITRPQRDLHPLTAFDVTSSHAALGADVNRFAAASALCEIVLKCAPPEPHPEIFDALSAGLDALEYAPAEDAPAVTLLALWGMVVALGFSPALDNCVVCRSPVSGLVSFSTSQGGALCAVHRAGTRTATLSAADAGTLRSLASGRMPEGRLDDRHAAAHRRLLLGFIRHHLAEQHDMPALAFWDADAWTTSS